MFCNCLLCLSHPLAFSILNQIIYRKHSQYSLPEATKCDQIDYLNFYMEKNSTHNQTLNLLSFLPQFLCLITEKIRAWNVH